MMNAEQEVLAASQLANVDPAFFQNIERRGMQNENSISRFTCIGKSIFFSLFFH
jgi:hypothetical protein